jgi:hypothetical protein
MHSQALQTMLLEHGHAPKRGKQCCKSSDTHTSAADNAAGAATRPQALQTMLQKQRHTHPRVADNAAKAATHTQAQQTMLHESYNNHPLSNCHRSSINSYYCCTSAAETLNQRQMTAPQLQNQQPRREVQARPHAASSTTADNFFADGILYNHKYYNLRAKKYIHYDKHDK